jgi:MOSC domain-containing protein YiiM
MSAHIVSVAVGRPRIVSHNSKQVLTSIFKSPVSGRVPVSLLNIAGDEQSDLEVHGGRDKAVYVYAEKHYASWASELGVDALEVAQFGENLTVSGLDESTVIIGDRYQFGSTIAVVAQPRLPCFKLGIRMHDDRFPQRFLASGRLGFYLRIEQEGEIGSGDTFELLERPGHGISVQRLWRIVFGDQGSGEVAAHCLESLPHLDEGWVRRLKKVRG